ncbi:hypothetical protein C1H46_020180 [Malus baccata]|uniref:RNase H type-1 domain-containing protein n=1 Tax=Malus baccata TaxID=106549 RepID=A0A540M6B4_MALBA|nr:hypothetical protein C1H46_020180 [Malus baccata]
MVCPPLGDTRSFLPLIAHIEMRHIRREANQAAHRLARARIGRHCDVLWFEDPPDLI